MNNNRILLEKLTEHGARPLGGIAQKENLRLTLRQILGKPLWPTSSKLRLSQEEFEVYGEMRITIPTTNLKSRSNPD